MEAECPFYGWSRYMRLPWDDYKRSNPDEADSIVDVVSAFIQFFERDAAWVSNTDDIDTLRAVPLDYQLLVDERRGFPDREVLIQVLDQDPAIILDCLSLAFYELACLRWEHAPLQKIYARLYNLEEVTPLRSLKSTSINKFVSIRGTAVRVSNIKPLVESMMFKCSRCNVEFQHALTEGCFVLPDKCVTASCKSKGFDPVMEKAITIDAQTIKVQELSDNSVDPGRVPRTIEVELRDDLVDCCVPGDVVTICGIVKVKASQRRMRGKQSSVYVTYVDANSLSSTKRGDNSKLDLIQFTTKVALICSSILCLIYGAVQELRAIHRILQAPYIFGLLVKSICPTIFGNEMVKAGLVLSLFVRAKTMFRHFVKELSSGPFDMISFWSLFSGLLIFSYLLSLLYLFNSSGLLNDFSLIELLDGPFM